MGPIRLSNRQFRRALLCLNGLAPAADDDPLPALAPVVEAMRSLPAPPRGMRLLSPFDPLIHDRRRALRVCFDYAIEIWVPPKKRKHGCYVLPILEGERFTGRIDAKVDRKRGTLTVLGLWWEPGVRATAARRARLERRLHELGEFAGGGELILRRGYDRN